MKSPPLAELTTLGVGGPAREFVRAENEAAVLEALELSERERLPLHVLGGGSNLVVADAGVPGVLLQMATRGVHFEEHGEGCVVTAQAGEPWDALTELVSERGYAGLECLGGIPGLVGATPIQNVGAYGQEVSDSIVRVRAMERATHEVVEFEREACQFGYRDSFFKQAGSERFVVLSVSYALGRRRAARPDYPELAHALGRPAAEVTPEEARRVVVALRRRKSMVLDPTDENARSCGSFFVNALLTSSELGFLRERTGLEPPAFQQENGLFKVPAAWLIERAGLEKGTRRGNVGLSTKHTLAIVAQESASASEVVTFARHVQSTVRDAFRVTLSPEPQFWGFETFSFGLPSAP